MAVTNAPTVSPAPSKSNEALETTQGLFLTSVAAETTSAPSVSPAPAVGSETASEISVPTSEDQNKLFLTSSESSSVAPTVSPAPVIIQSDATTSPIAAPTASPSATIPTTGGVSKVSSTTSASSPMAGILGAGIFSALLTAAMMIIQF